MREFEEQARHFAAKEIRVAKREQRVENVRKMEEEVVWREKAVRKRETLVAERIREVRRREDAVEEREREV